MGTKTISMLKRGENKEMTNITLPNSDLTIYSSAAFRLQVLISKHNQMMFAGFGVRFSVSGLRCKDQNVSYSLEFHNILSLARINSFRK